MFFLLALHAELENFKTIKVFICLSTVMTWARSKPLDPVSLYIGSFSFTVLTKQLNKQANTKQVKHKQVLEQRNSNVEEFKC